MIHPFHKQIGCLVSSKSPGEHLAEELFRCEVEHFDLTAEATQSLRHYQVLQTMPLESVALRADCILAGSSKRTDGREGAMIAAYWTFKPLFAAVQELEKRCRRTDLGSDPAKKLIPT
jgi:hypothetical protein